ncbi:hypothetical protein Pelo_10090 [Pelomyxa schiedti]|nr:hypothetical protein Pelo_10090 [Pelomyxa schiedti]
MSGISVTGNSKSTAPQKNKLWGLPYIRHSSENLKIWSRFGKTKQKRNRGDVAHNSDTVSSIRYSQILAKQKQNRGLLC